jgi:hypothetical protein
MGNVVMRREILRASPDASVDGHTIYFQISNGIGRFACSVIANVPTREHAMQLFSHNWHRIEEIARECLADHLFDGCEIRLVMA